MGCAPSIHPQPIAPELARPPKPQRGETVSSEFPSSVSKGGTSNANSEVSSPDKPIGPTGGKRRASLFLPPPRRDSEAEPQSDPSLSPSPSPAPSSPTSPTMSPTSGPPSPSASPELQLQPLDTVPHRRPAPLSRPSPTTSPPPSRRSLTRSSSVPSTSPTESPPPLPATPALAALASRPSARRSSVFTGASTVETARDHARAIAVEDEIDASIVRRSSARALRPLALPPERRSSGSGGDGEGSLSTSSSPSMLCRDRSAQMLFDEGSAAVASDDGGGPHTVTRASRVGSGLGLIAQKAMLEGRRVVAPLKRDLLPRCELRQYHFNVMKVGLTGGVCCAALSSNCEYFVASSPYSSLDLLFRRRVVDGESLITYAGQRAATIAVALSAGNGLLAAATVAASFGMFDFASGKFLCVRDTAGVITCVALCPTGPIALLGSDGGGCMLVSFHATRGTFGRGGMLLGHTGAVSACRFGVTSDLIDAPCDITATSSLDGTVRLWACSLAGSELVKIDVGAPVLDVHFTSPRTARLHDNSAQFNGVLVAGLPPSTSVQHLGGVHVLALTHQAATVYDCASRLPLRTWRPPPTRAPHALRRCRSARVQATPVGVATLQLDADNRSEESPRLMCCSVVGVRTPMAVIGRSDGRVDVVSLTDGSVLVDIHLAAPATCISKSVTLDVGWRFMCPSLCKACCAVGCTHFLHPLSCFGCFSVLIVSVALHYSAPTLNMLMVGDANGNLYKLSLDQA